MWINSKKSTAVKQKLKEAVIVYNKFTTKGFYSTAEQHQHQYRPTVVDFGVHHFSVTVSV